MTKERTTLQQDLVKAREELERIVSAGAYTGSYVSVFYEDAKDVIGRLEALERKLQTARCTAISALEDL